MLPYEYLKHPSFALDIVKVLAFIVIREVFPKFMVVVVAFYSYFVLFAFTFSMHLPPFSFTSFN